MEPQKRLTPDDKLGIVVFGGMALLFLFTNFGDREKDGWFVSGFYEIGERFSILLAFALYWVISYKWSTRRRRR